MDDARRRRFADFVAWSAAHITGDEKAEAQIFLERLFLAFGHSGLFDCGAKLEMRVKARDDRGTSFADCVWKPVVLIEMKKRGELLARHLSQAFEYWVRLAPNRPRWVVLCNFDEFRIYDFDIDVNEPQDTLALGELTEYYEALAFLFPTIEKPKFKIDRLRVTREAADHLAEVYRRVAKRKDIGPATAQRFILQMLIALFSEDIGLLPRHFVTELLEECKDPPTSFNLLEGLFRAMSAREPARGGRFKDVPYFNGGIFSEPAPVELHEGEREHLYKAAHDYNWAHVSPDIFGTIFQHTIEKRERRALGAHYTFPSDIMKIVGPTIVQPWRSAIAAADSAEKLARLHDRLFAFRVLDPACGSGNFLYIAYRELKRLEKELLEKLREVAPARYQQIQRSFGFVGTRQFYGMDVLPFAVELAKVTMTIAHKLAIDELHSEEKALPLDNLDDNIRCVDALIDRDHGATEWPPADVIIGNPPFGGSRYFAKQRGYDYARTVHATFPDTPKMADYCVYWFRRAHDHLPVCTAADPLAGRAGLVGTQNIRNNESRIGGLDHVVQSGTIVEAVESQPWSGEANVHVSIANWIKHDPSLKSELQALLVPEKRKLWHKVTPELPLKRAARAESAADLPSDAPKRKDKTYELAARECSHINSALSAEIDVSGAVALACNTEPQQVFQGQNPANDKFMLPVSEARRLLASDRKLRDVLVPYMIGRDLVTDGRPSRYVIDFGKRDMLAAAKYPKLFERVKLLVMPDVLKRANEERKATGRESTRWTRMAERWWQFRDQQPGLMAAIAKIPRYVVCSRTTKRPIFAFVSSKVHPDTKLMVFPFCDDYTFGVLQSSAHWLWFVTKCSKLKSDFSYTPRSVWDTFAWPQSPSRDDVKAVARAAVKLRRRREEALPGFTGGLRAVYRTLELPGKSLLKVAHADLDAAVLRAYGFGPNRDLLTQLLTLNQLVARRIERGEPVTAPGVPLSFANPRTLVTEDCIDP